ncbi:MAG: hypothetical protein QW404_00565 [Candidatus Nanoarchaeia archaeon]
MKKLTIVALILLIGITAAVAISENGNRERICKDDCINNSKLAYEACKSNYTEGKKICKEAFKICMNQTKTFRNECNNLKPNMTEYRACIKEVNNMSIQCVKTHYACDKQNRDKYLGCLKEARTQFEGCRKICKIQNMDEKECKRLGGTWNPCASACGEEAENCIDVCVPKCEFKTCETAEDCREHGYKKYNCINHECIKDP